MDILDIHAHRPLYPQQAIQNITPKFLPERLTGHYYSAGIHPWDIHLDTWQNPWNLLVSSASDADILAIGETGLDKCCQTPFDIQLQVFEKHILLAEKLQKPLIIHCVRSFSEIMSIRKQGRSSVPWIIHGFRGNKILAEQLLKHGFYLSLGEKYQEESLRSIPLTHLFLETDDSQRDIHELYKKAALLKQIPADVFENAIKQNIQAVFFKSL
jgi:TatD DNase family protein